MEVHSRIQAELRERGVGEELVAQVTALIPKDILGVLLYGSRARGDHVPGSDVDVIGLVPMPIGSRSFEGANLSFYTADQLRSASGTLFGMHLERDGVVLFDRDGTLGPIVASLQPPVAEVLLARVRHYSTLLHVEDDERSRYLDGLVRLGRYLLRTAIYGLALKDGHPCFSVRELAARFGKPELVQLLASDAKARSGATREVFAEIVSRLVEIVGSPSVNQFQSLRALIVAEWYSDRNRATLGTLVIADRKDAFDYAQLPKVLL